MSRICRSLMKLSLELAGSWLLRLPLEAPWPSDLSEVALRSRWKLCVEKEVEERARAELRRPLLP